jgi:hypothetical protein
MQRLGMMDIHYKLSVLSGSEEFPCFLPSGWDGMRISLRVINTTKPVTTFTKHSRKHQKAESAQVGNKNWQEQCGSELPCCESTQWNVCRAYPKV